MSRSMKFGVATIVATFVFTLLIPDDAEARHRRRGRWRNGGHHHSSNGCCGAPVSCCGVAAAPVSCPTGACGVATSACPGGVCDVSGGAYSGGYSAGYGANYGSGHGSTVQGQPNLAPTPNGTYRQNGLNQSAPPPAPNGGTIRQETQLNGSAQGGTSASPSDRSGDRPPAPAGGEGSTNQGADRSAPPPPPEQ